jgi:hypothetical protein
MSLHRLVFEYIAEEKTMKYLTTIVLPCAEFCRFEGLSERPLCACAVTRRRFPVGERPTRQSSLQPEAIGAVMEVTK